MRHAWTINEPALLAPLHHAEQWPNLTTIVKVQAERYSGNDPDPHSVQTRYCLRAGWDHDYLLSVLQPILTPP